MPPEIVVNQLKIPLDFTHIFCSAIEILNVFLTIFLGFFVFLHNPQDIKKRVYLILSLAVACVSLSGPIVYTLAYNNLINYAVSSLNVTMQIIIPSLLLHLYLLFPEGKARKSVVICIYAPVAMLLTYYYCSGLTENNFQIISGVMNYKFHHYIIFILYSGLYYLIIVFILVYKIKRAQNKLHKNQIIYILTGLILGGLVDIVLILVRSFTKNPFLRLSPELSSFFMIFFIFYAIVKYQAYDIKTAIHYSLYRLFSGIIIFSPLIFLPLLILGEAAKNQLALSYSLWGIGAVLYFILVNRLVMPFINKITLRRKYQLSSELDLLFEKLDISFTLKNMEQKIFDSIEENLHTPDMAVLTFDKTRHAFSGKFVASGDYILLAREATGNIQEGEPVLTRNFISATGEVFRDLIAHKVELIAKIMSRDETTGLLCLCAKKNLKPYYYEEIEFIKKVAKRIALVLEKNYVEEIGKLKSEYFVHIAHELKTPLTIMENFLADDVAKRGITKEISIVEENFNKMKNDITSLLDLERLENSRGLYIHDQILDFSRVLSLKTELFKEIAETSPKKICLTARLETDIYLKMNPYALDRVINNLLENAIKYNRDNGRISVVLRATETESYFSVTDTGIGIPDEHKEQIFAPYYQISRQQGYAHGIGIGLSIVKKIVDQVDGGITISDNPGGGTSFLLTFKRHLLLPGEQVCSDIEYAKPVREFTIKLPAQKYEPDKATILIVEDNAAMLYYLHTNLSRDFNVFTAANGQLAIETLDAIPAPQLIISDIMMDTMDGFALLQVLQQRESFAKIPLLFLTAKTTPGDRYRALAGGAIDFISKPFLIQDLILKIKAIIKNEQVQRKAYIGELERKIHKVLTEDMNEERKNEILFTRLNGYYITRREYTVIQAILKGLNTSTIASELAVSVSTVKNHVNNIYDKLKITNRNRIELINFINSLRS